MNSLVTYVLAAMLHYQPVGMSQFSKVPLDYCDATCAAEPLCEDKSDIHCQAPVLDTTRLAYVKAQLRRDNPGVTKEELDAAARPRAYVRVETAEEAAARYLVIAESIVEVAENSTRAVCVEQKACYSKDLSKGEQVSCVNSCKEGRPWVRSKEDLVWALVTVTSFESGWRQDVQTGTGYWGRGDCHWTADGTLNKPKRKAHTKGTRPVLSSCRSFGLGQANFGPYHKLKVYEDMIIIPRHIIGMDKQHTWAQLKLATIHLSRAYNACARKSKDWAHGMFSLYGTGRTCDFEKLAYRAKRYRFIRNARKQISNEDKEILALESVKNMADFLRSTPRQILWFPVYNPEVATKEEQYTNSPYRVAQQP